MLIRNCWDEDPDRRPDFKKIENTLWKIVRSSLCAFVQPVKNLTDIVTALNTLDCVRTMYNSHQIIILSLINDLLI